MTADTNDAPTITLAGKEWPVPLLVPRQQRVIIPAILRLGSVNPTKITEQQYDDLVEIAFRAISRAHPQFTKEQLLDMPVTLIELISALPVIAQQTGMLAFKKGDDAGEARAGNSLTGTGSSPTSASAPAGPGITSKTT